MLLFYFLCPFRLAFCFTLPVLTELGRTHEKLTHVEGQIASLEEHKTAAEQALHRVQNEMREALDLVNSTKKHSVVLQDTITVRTSGGVLYFLFLGVS